MKSFSELIPLSDPVAWDAAVASVSSAPAHRHSFIHAFSLSSDDPTYLLAHHDDNGHVDLICPVSIRGRPGECDAYSPFGFGGFALSARSGSEILAVWDGFAREQEWVASYIFQNPLLHAHTDVGTFSPSHELFVLDLTPSIEELLSGMSQSRRREIRRWERSPAPLTTDRGAVAAFMISTSASFFDSRDASATYQFAELTWSGLVESDDVFVVGALDDCGDVVAASMFATGPEMVDYVFGISRPGSERFSAALIWEAIKYSREHDLIVMNLGGGISPDDGVAVFKQRFGAEAVRSQVLKRVHRPALYEQMCARSGVSLDDAYFPPYRRVRAHE